MPEMKFDLRGVKFAHPVHGECEVIDKSPVTERTRSILVRRMSDDAKLYLSSSCLETAGEPPGESSAAVSPTETLAS